MELGVRDDEVPAIVAALAVNRRLKVALEIATRGTLRESRKVRASKVDMETRR
jgi:hypothetical protein